MRRRIAAFLALAAIASGAGAWIYWTNGIPPTWSWFAERARTEVLLSEVVEDPNLHGLRGHKPHVEVAWPPGSGSASPLPGVEPHHVPRTVWTAEQIVGDYPVGERTTVRVIAGRPYADRTDITEMSYAVFFSLATVVCLGCSGYLASTRPGGGGEEGT